MSTTSSGNNIQEEFKHHAGDEYSRIFFPKSAIKALAKLSSNHPDGFTELFGSPGSKKKLLMDACLGYHFLIPLHQNFGYVTALMYAEQQNSKVNVTVNISDQQLFQYAKEEGFDAIVTMDAKKGSPRDLSYIANEAYQNAKPDDALPHIIVLPIKPKKALEKLTRHAQLIKKYLSTPATQVLNLRKESVSL